MSTTQPERDAGGRFAPGSTGNRAGRPKGLAARVRELVGDDGLPLAEVMLTISQGKPYAGLEPTLRDVMDATRWLSDRGWGRVPVEEVESVVDPAMLVALELSRLPRAELEKVARGEN